MIPRTIHASRGSCFTGASKWIVAQLAPLVNDLAHLAKDSQHMKRKLQSFPACAVQSRFAAIDMKDFYQSGSQAEIIETLVRNVPFPTHRI